MQLGAAGELVSAAFCVPSLRFPLATDVQESEQN